MRGFFIEAAIANPLVNHPQADFLRYPAAHEQFEKVAAHGTDDAGNDLTLALDSADDRRLARSHAAATRSAPLIPMPVLRLAADEGFVNFHDPHKLAEIFVRQTSSHPVAHIPSRLVRTETHVAEHLKGADPFLAGQHQVDDAEPLPQRLIGVLEDRPADMREAVVGSRGRPSVAEP